MIFILLRYKLRSAKITILFIYNFMNIYCQNIIGSSMYGVRVFLDKRH
jgi:hypothetical protein